MTLNKENIAAITAEIFTHPKYKELYDKFCDSVSGTPGFWSFAVEAADVFSKLEQRLGLEWDGEYMEAVEDYASGLLTLALAQSGLPTEANMLAIAERVIADLGVTRIRRPRKAKRSEMVTLRLPRLDVGQIVDGLTIRQESWSNTAKFLDSGENPDNFFGLEDCSNPDEARNIAAHYGAIITTIEEQRQR